ncbi:helix-turn-helix transcriptional regulator [Streptomyces qinzhouensis]|uniref:Helix-turn-helix transcriptional regulator n=2 Tax=Streptomyces qinzhouensis TaxID=2599401 RepID=A0A5B8JIG8_9ACTN|nr:LuxR C-terminal-related transcriptional regulator [Streptomyces qinzhouensis]QDY81417.1 helix-turn-helix transcriptional regulator [Streptomyces qinzhouensis]
MACLDRSLTVQQGNQEFFGRFGGDTAQPCGRPFTDLVHPSVQQPLLRKFAGLTEGKRDRFTSEVLAVGPDGRAFTASLSACAVRSGTPDVSAIWVMMASDGEPVDTDVMPSRKKMLSEIDARILEGIAAGVSTVPLAARLYLSRQGVEYHVTCLFRKLRVPNRAALVSRAYSMGVLKVGMWPPKVVEDFVK